jgi:hypothetical protein
MLRGAGLFGEFLSCAVRQAVGQTGADATERMALAGQIE